MLKRLFTLTLMLSLILSSVLTFSPSSVQAALSGSQFRAGRIIDDVLFYNGSSMSASQIQNFLDAKVPVCDTNGTKPYGNTTRAAYGTSRGYPPPYICLKNYRQNTPSKNAESGICSALSARTNRTAAQIIDDVARACGISQKALIAILQKESAGPLVTDDWPWSSQYRAAMGYGCPDTAPCDSQYYGFFNQIYNAARQFKRYKANPSAWNHIPGAFNNVLYQANKPECGSKSVYIENYATAGLYNYTPYTPNQAALNNLYGTGDGCSAYGNRNFWRIYNDWFGSTLSNALPGDARLLRSSSSGMIYLVAAGTRHYIPNGEYMAAYKLDGVSVTSVSSQQLNSYSDGGSLTNLVRDPETGRIDMVNAGKRYWAFSGTVCSNWGLACFDSNSVTTLPVELYNRLLDDGQLKPLARSSSGVVYQLDDGKKLPIFNEIALKDLGFTWNNVLTVQSINLSQPLGNLRITRPGVLRFSPNPAIYYFNGSTFHQIPDMYTLTAWNLSSKVSIPATSSYNQTPPTTGDPLNTRAQSGSSKYLVDSGKKYLLNSNQLTLLPDAGYQTFSSSLLNSLSNSSLNSFLRIGVNIYKIDGDKIRYVPSAYDLKNLGHIGSNQTNLQSQALSQFEVGEDILASGSLVKNASDGKVYVVSGNKLHYIPGPSVFSAYRFNWSAIKTYNFSNLTSYSIGPELTVKAKLSQGFSYFENGTNYYISSSRASSYGLSTGGYMSLNDKLAGFSSRVVVSTPFIRNRTTGAIYYGSGGEIHYVSSMRSFRLYGGNSNPLVTVPGGFINTFLIGKPI